MAETNKYTKQRKIVLQLECVPTFPFVSGVAGCSLETAAVSVLVRTPVTASLGLAAVI